MTVEGFALGIDGDANVGEFALGAAEGADRLGGTEGEYVCGAGHVVVMGAGTGAVEDGCKGVD